MTPEREAEIRSLLAQGMVVDDGIVRDLLTELDCTRQALSLLADKAEQYFDTGRGDLDGAVAHAREVLP